MREKSKIITIEEVPLEESEYLLPVNRTGELFSF